MIKCLIFRMLEESGLLHEEPAKLFPDLQMTPETKTRTTKSKRAPYVKGSKQASSAASSGTSSSSNQTKQLNRRSSDVNEVYSAYYYHEVMMVSFIQNLYKGHVSQNILKTPV